MKALGVFAAFGAILVAGLFCLLMVASINEGISHSYRPFQVAISLGADESDIATRQFRCREQDGVDKAPGRLVDCADIVPIGQVKSIDACSIVGLLLGCRHYGIDAKALQQPKLLASLKAAMRNPCEFSRNDSAMAEYIAVKSGGKSGDRVWPNDYFCRGGVSLIVLVFVDYKNEQVHSIEGKPRR